MYRHKTMVASVIQRIKKLLPTPEGLQTLLKPGEYNHPEFDKGYLACLTEVYKALDKVLQGE